MGIRPRFTPGANALQIENGWRLEIPAGAAGFYRLAQLDDYASLPRSRFPHQPTTTLSLSCRVIGAAPTPGPPAPKWESPKNGRGGLPGTWGFGFWNDPFSVSLGLQGAAQRLPVLPNACWFFHASEENYLSFAPETKVHRTKSGESARLTAINQTSDSTQLNQVRRTSLPGNGFLAQVFSSPRIPSGLLAPGILAAPLLSIRPFSKWLRANLAAKLIREEGKRLEVDPAQWHEYRLRWSPQGVEFAVNGENVLETEVSPQGPLGLVIWIDNQFMAWRPDGSLRMGTLANPGMGMEIRGLEVRSDE